MKVPVNGKVLAWARNLRGLTIEDAARRLGIPVPELVAQEQTETTELSLGSLRVISVKYEIGLSSLLMPEPLPPDTQPRDNRSRAHRLPLTMETLLAIEEVSNALDTFVELAEDSSALVSPLRIGKARLSDSPSALAARERTRIGVSIEEQKSWSSQSNARIRWRERIEALGVFTYMIPMPPNELSGFSLCRDGLAAICVNDREPTEGAKIFTLFHEYCHVLLRQSEISDEDNSVGIERFCNRFAANFLIPKDALLAATHGPSSPRDFTDDEVRKLSVMFRVSNRAMAYRLQETGIAPANFYDLRTAPWDIPKVRIPRKRQGEFRINPIPGVIKKVGKLHATTALRASKTRLFSAFDASHLLGLGPDSFGKLESALK